MPQEKYWSTLCNRFGSGWTRFWFTPSDPIVLCMLRFMVGLVALWWFLSLLPVVQEWYGPQGTFPLSLTEELRKDAAGDTTFAIPVLDWVNTPSLLWLVYYLGLASIVLMIAGVLSRITTIAALLFVLSFIHRGLMFTRPVDDILAMMMFYLCLGPTGTELSVDALIRQRRQRNAANGAVAAPPAIRYSSAATVAIRLMQIHLALIYGAMFIAQLQGEAWWQGTAVWWIMARPDSRLVDFTGVSNTGDLAFEYLINFGTHAILLFEACFALLIWNPLARPILLVVGVIYWVGLALISGWISFAVLMLFANLAYVSPATLRRWTGREFAAPRTEPALATA
jgi:hypothetical protein